MKKIFTLCVVLCLTYLSMGATNPKHEFRATWLTTAWGNDWPKTRVTNATTRKQQQDSLIAIFDRLQAGNMNAVCFQVRGRSDAFYQSSYEPWAAELAGARGKDPGYDPLAFAIEEAHKRGLELHAWVNPFRVTSAGTLDANDLVKKNAGQWIIQYNNGSFSGQIIDPGYPEAREYVLNVLMEIISNYDIDGIVMDDYFYPYGGTTTEDAASKALHKPANVVDVNQDGYTDDDWRRSNVDVFLKELYDRIQAKKPWVRFGMGTFGIWTTQTKVAQAYGIALPSGISGLDDYDEQACNPVEWVKNGYVDYINPQLYWPTTSTGQNYNKLCQWWAKDVCEHFSNQLTNGKKVHFFSSQSISSNSAVSEIQAEIDANRSNLSSGYTGSVFFDTDAYLTMDKDLMTSRFATNALTPPMDWKSKTALSAPTNLTISGTTLTWKHATAERFTVYVYPKGTAWSTAKNDPAYLQGVIYGNSMDISGIDTNMNDIAVCAYDRFGVEHTAAVYSNDSGAGTTPNPETIIWELNGGEVNTVTVEVPSLTTLEAQFKNDYNSYFGAAVATTREITNFLYYGSKEEGGSNLVYNMMNDPVADWTWLRDYIISKSASNTTIQTALLAGTDAHWRYSIVAFLTASAGTNSTYTVDFSIAGQPSKWGTAYQIAHGAVLLPTYVTSAYTLPAPVHPSRYEFLGWYDNAEFAGSPLTTIPANWTGTLYAQWQENAPTIDPTWQILYTSTDGNVVEPYKTNVFGANIVSNIYENGVGTITFDGPVTSIGDGAFTLCASLTTVTIGNSVTSIGDNAFDFCAALSSITIPNSVTSIGDEAFTGCSSLTSITIPSSVTHIGVRAFSSHSIESIVVDSENATYDSRNNCNAIIEKATNSLIAGCQKTIIPNSVTSIGKMAFYNCSSLASITIPNSIKSISSSAFYGCSSLTSLTIPNSVTSIEKEAFHACSSLTSITIPNSVTSIGEWVFYDCSSLTSITIPESVTNIGNSAFYGCSSIASITIPESVTSIGKKAFDKCSSLDTIYVEATTPPALGENVFASSPVCHIPCGTLATYESSAWARQVGGFVGDCPPASAAITYVLNGGVQSEWETPQAMYNELNALWNTFSGTSKTWGDLSTLKADVAKGIPTLAYGMALDFIADENFKEKFEWLVTYMDAKCTEQGQTLPSSDASFLRYNLQAFFIDGMRTSWPISADYTICGVSTVEAYQPYWKSGFANPTNPTEEFVLNAPYKEGYTFAGWYTNADFSGEKVTTINAETTGTLYAKWINNDWIITYTSTDGNIVKPNKTGVFGANIVSNEYKDGQGVITFDGPVTSIGEEAFNSRKSLTSITIPNSVTSIGERAFKSCESLPSVVIPNSVTSIGTSAFWYCSSLASVTIPTSVTSIGENAFADCPSLESITIPNSVTSIGLQAFFNSGLRSISIPNSVESIGMNAFRECYYLTSVTIGSGVTSIGNAVFSSCHSLTSMVVEAGNPIYDSRENCNAIIEKATNTLIAGCSDTSIPSSVKSIGDWAFYGCYYLTSITIPNSVTSIGADAFNGCTSLSSITIPNSVTSIGGEAFARCNNIKTIHIKATTPPSIGLDIFSTKVRTANIPCGTKEAYEDSDWVLHIIFFEEDCSEPIDPTWQITYTSTDGSTVTPNKTDVFGANIVSNEYKDGQGVITFDGPVTSIGEEAFWSCESLTSITIPKSVTSIGAYAFVTCCSLTSITIPNSVTSIGEAAFDDCSSLTSVTIPESVTSIGYHAFWSCESLTSITIPNSVTSIGEAAFAACRSLTSIVVEPGNTTYDSRENCNAIIETATNTLIAGCQNTVIPNTVTSIGNLAFFHCFSLTSATIGSGVTSIGNRAFEGCSSLASITIPNSVTSIGENAFSGCTSLISVTLGSGVTSIRFATFSRCSSLTSVTLGSGVTSIEVWAFGDCTALTSITCEATTPPTLESSVFPSELTTAYIPCGSLAAYEASDWASQVGEFVEEGCAPIQMCGDDLYWEYADGVLTITGTGDMYDYAKDTDVPWYDVRGNIKTVSLPDAMTKIGQNAFYKCTNMTTINMPTSLTAIGEKAFAQDTKLACEIILPASMTTIASRAFFNCQAVTAFHIEATTPPTIPNDAFERTTAPIHVPCGYGHIYGKHTQWGELNLEMCELLQDNVYYYPIDGHTARAVTYHSNPTDTIVIPSAVVIDDVPRTVTEVADFAFTDCANLPAIYFSEGLEYIGERAFVRCYGLQGTIVLPATLETIGERAFSYCNNVDRYTIQAMTPPVLGANAFTGDNKNALFYISCEAMDDYKVATNWSSLKSRLRDACLNIYHYNTALGANGVHTTEDTLVANIDYRRKFTTSRWETLYLPFEVDRVTVLEDGVEYDLTAWDIVNGGHYYLAKPYGIENKEVVFAFTQVVDAHTPYIIQFKDPYFHDKMITFHGKESWNKLSSSFEALPISFEMQMAGNTTLQDQILEEPVYMLRGTSNFILQNTTTTLHPFECYVMPYATPSGTPARMNVRFRGDVPTAVESVKGNESYLTYSVDGYTLTVYPQGQAFSIYSLNGALIYSCEAGKEAVDCELNSGCYLLHAGAEAHKIML